MKIVEALAFILFTAGCMQAFQPASSSTIVKSSTSRDLSMKIFDWKKREAFEKYEIPDDYVLSVNTIQANPGARKRFLRVGRGIAAGQGGACGRGMRGQKSRSGKGGKIRPGFEGGQMPLYRRLPKFVGKPMRNHVKTIYELIKLDVLNSVAEGSEVDASKLFDMGEITKANKGRKIYKVIGGDEELKVSGLTVKAHKFTESARAAIEAAGGKCVVMSPTREGITLEQNIADNAALDAERLVKLKARRDLLKKRDDAKLAA